MLYHISTFIIHLKLLQYNSILYYIKLYYIIKPRKYCNFGPNIHVIPAQEVEKVDYIYLGGEKRKTFACKKRKFN